MKSKGNIIGVVKESVFDVHVVVYATILIALSPHVLSRVNAGNTEFEILSRALREPWICLTMKLVLENGR
jgi:hypothetical protein